MSGWEVLWTDGIGLMILIIFCFLPIALTVGNFLWCFFCFPEGRMKKLRTAAEWMTLILGPLYSLCFIVITNISFNADWWVQLYNEAVHAPIATWTWPTILTLLAAAGVGYLILRLVPLKKMPPLVVVFSMAAMYLGILLAVLWCIQLTGSSTLPHHTFEIWDLWNMWLAVFPVNCILLALERIHILVVQWQEIQWEEMEQEGQRLYRNRFLRVCNEKLMDSGSWPLAALIAMLPLLGVLLLILVLFGQSPDAAIAAFTQTSDWRLSTQVGPPNLHYDEHYLCTVAAGGHRKLVKPLRRGLRHGHPVTVNRQLCIANAFEQILEERMPRFHGVVRHFYDTYGLPVAKLIRSPFAADAVYVLMKPLEWIFLIVIYFCDTKPENRIAMQYTK